MCATKAGRLPEGWEAYERRFQSGAVPREQPSNQPRWDASDPAGKTILVWAEQGLGDQLLFFRMVPDLMRAGAHCVVECDGRLVRLLERSFAGAEVVPYSTPPDPRVQRADIDFQIPVGSLARWFRPSLESFPKTSGYLVADSFKVSRWKQLLEDLGEGLKVGICWRSGMTEGSRSMYYSQLSQWGPVLTTADVRFINLQYGECGEELKEAERMFGTRVQVWKDMDLKNDQDGLAALMSALDLVIPPARRWTQWRARWACRRGWFCAPSGTCGAWERTVARGVWASGRFIVGRRHRGNR